MLAGVNCTGLVQIENDAPSNEHSNCFIPTPLPSLPPVSLPENANVAELDDVLPPVVMKLPLPSVAVLIVIRGAKVSTVHVKDAGVRSLFPALSSDKTVKVWVPSFSKSENMNGLVQGTYLELSILHSKWLIPAPLSSLPPVSLPENLNDMEVELELVPLATMVLLPSIAVLINVVGDRVSTFQVNDAGNGLVFPTLSWDLTLNVWVPSFIKLEKVNGLVQ